MADGDVLTCLRFSASLLAKVRGDTYKIAQVRM